MVRLRDFACKGIEVFTLIFEAKYLVCPKILLMVIYSIILLTSNSLSPPLESYHFTEPVIFHASCTPGMVNKMNNIPTLSSFGNCPKYTSLHIREPIKLQLKILHSK